MSLRVQLITTIALALLATLGLGALLVHWHAVEKIETEMTAAIASGARIARNAVDDDHEFVNPKRRLVLLVADFDGDRHLRATVRDKSDAVVLSSKPSRTDDPAPPWLVRWLWQVPKTTQLSLPSAFDDHGRLFLETDPINEIAEVWEDLLIYLKLLAVFSVAALGVTLFVLARALAPLRHLNDAFRRIGRGDYGFHLPERGPSELLELSKGFNAMASRLAAGESRNNQLVDQLSRVQEEERAELARNLHDEVSPLLFSVDVDATTIRHLAVEGRIDAIRDKADLIQAAIGSMKSNVRGILEQLRPPMEEDRDWRAAIRELIAFWQERFPEVEFRLDIAVFECPPAIGLVLRYVTGESVGNALKHAEPKHVELSISPHEGFAVATVTDDGSGLRDGQAGYGFGIVGMRERVERAGGSFEMRARVGSPGLAVTARLPLSDDQRMRHGDPVGSSLGDVLVQAQ